MWVMLTTKLPTVVSPPKMSIHWAIPWPDDRIIRDQCNRVLPKKAGKKSKNIHNLEFIGNKYYNFLSRGYEPHWAGARKILYKNEYIRIFSHEFSILKSENMNCYINESHDFVSGTAAEDKIFEELKLGGEKQILYEVALLWGATEEQAKLLALGFDALDSLNFPPPIGWYKIKHEYGSVFCNERELTE